VGTPAPAPTGRALPGRRRAARRTEMVRAAAVRVRDGYREQGLGPTARRVARVSGRQALRVVRRLGTAAAGRWPRRPGSGSG
jgi:hypothetical protein